MKTLLLALTLLGTPSANPKLEALKLKPAPAPAAPSKPVELIPPAELLDDGRTPIDRYKLGARAEGAFDANDAARCSQKALSAHGWQLFAPSAVLPVNDKVGQTASTLTRQVGAQVEAELADLRKAGDLDVLGRHVCIGFNLEAQSPIGNAAATSDGYLLVDSRIFVFLNGLPDAKRGMYARDYVLLHELAHHLQYWLGDPWVAGLREGLTTNVRHAELAADCVSAALISRRWKGRPADLIELSKRGVVETATALGDLAIDSPQHHGKPAERRLATEVGLAVGLALDGQVTSKALLDGCNRAVREMDALDAKQAKQPK